MRNLALREEPDFDSMPRRNRANGRSTAKAASARHASPMRGLLVMNWRRFLIITSAALLGAVVVNALFFQTARHPAPLFSHGSSGATPAPQVVGAAPRVIPAAETPVPAPRPTDVAVATPSRPVAAPKGIADLIDPKPAASEPKGNDPIAALMKGAVAPGQMPVASIPAPAADASSKRALAAQKALAKLGYAVTVDGVIGSGTKQAIQKFERDRSLPLTGEIAGRTQRELAARSGIQIN